MRIRIQLTNEGEVRREADFIIPPSGASAQGFYNLIIRIAEAVTMQAPFWNETTGS